MLVRRSSLLALLTCVGAPFIAGCVLETGDVSGRDQAAPEEMGSAEAPIVGGQDADVGEYPFMARLTISGPNKTVRCDGTLVERSYVLTAAHCITNTSRAGAISQPGDITVVLGRTKMSDATQGQTRAVAEVIRHPSYETMAGTHDHDVAILRLSSASTIAPVAIASPYGPSDRALWKAGALMTVVGWGATSENGPQSDVLQEVQVPVVGDASAASHFGAAFDKRVHVAAGYADGGKDSCQGDSGGPMLAWSPNAAAWKQVGIVSWGYGCARKDEPGVYARIGAQRLNRWIRSVIHYTPAVGDVNGDGKDDIVELTHGDSTSGPLDTFVALSNGSTFGAVQKWGDWWAHRGHIPMVGDFNGDKKDDVWAFTGTDVWVQLSTGTSFGGAAYQSAASVTSPDDVPGIGDVNGDGRKDAIVFAADTNVYVLLAGPTGFGAKTLWKNKFADEGETPLVADVNGDGKDDIVLFSQGVVNSNVHVSLSTGSSFGVLTQYTGGSAYTSEMPGVGKFNADARADVVAFTRNATADVFVGVSAAGSLFSTKKWHDAFGSATSTMLVGDVNGDGRDDAVRFTQDAAADVFVALSSGSSFGAAYKAHDSFAP